MTDIAFSLVNGVGQGIKSWGAVSGAAGHQRPSEQSIKDVGPLPEGQWSLSVDNVQELGLVDQILGSWGRGTFPGGFNSWGRERAFLDALPGTNTFGRKDFSIHGGLVWGSRGCIDLGLEERDFFTTLQALGITKIELSVKYDPKLEDKFHPLAGHLTAASHCFAASTKVLLSNGEQKYIEDIVGREVVAAFDELGTLWPKKVKRIFRGLTQQWLLLSCGLVVTPGHRFLNESGRFERIDEIVARNGKIVREHGDWQHVSAEVVSYSRETHGLYEEADDVVFACTGQIARQPEICRGWRTYNFEVEDLHTYITGGRESSQRLSAELRRGRAGLFQLEHAGA